MKTVKCRSSSCQINYIEKFTLYETLRNYRPPWNERGAYKRTTGRWRKIDQEWEFSRAAVYTSSINREILSIELRVYSGGWTQKLFSTADDLRDFTRERSSKEGRKTVVKFYDRKEGNGGCVRVNLVLWSGQYRNSCQFVFENLTYHGYFDVDRIK